MAETMPTIQERLRKRKKMMPVPGSPFYSQDVPDELCIEAADLIDTLIKERDEARDWSPEMKAAAMADAQKVCEQHAALTKLKSERDALADALKPFAEFAERYGFKDDTDNVETMNGIGPQRITVGDLRRARDIRNAIEAAEVPHD